MEADEYDRRSEKTWVKLSPSDKVTILTFRWFIYLLKYFFINATLYFTKASIREELNLYKSNEMRVHEDSRQYTRYVAYLRNHIK